MSKRGRGGAGDVVGMLVAAVLVMWCTAALAQHGGGDDEPSFASDTGSGARTELEHDEDDAVSGLSAGRDIDNATQVLAMLGMIVFIQGAAPALALIAEGASLLGLVILFIYAIPAAIMIVAGFLH